MISQYHPQSVGGMNCLEYISVQTEHFTTNSATQCLKILCGLKQMFDLLVHLNLHHMAEYMNELYQWSLANNMQINKLKTKEMVITSSHTVSLPFIPILNGLRLLNSSALLCQMTSCATRTLLM